MDYQIRWLAKQTGYTPGHISRIVSGKRKPSVGCLQKLSGVTGLSMDSVMRAIRLGKPIVDVHGKDKVQR